jgi:hypothetical protein
MVDEVIASLHLILNKSNSRFFPVLDVELFVHLFDSTFVDGTQLFVTIVFDHSMLTRRNAPEVVLGEAKKESWC